MATTGVPIATVNRVCQTRKTEQELADKAKSGRPRKLGAREDRLVARKVIQKGTGTSVALARDLAPNLPQPVSAKTIGRSLQRQGFKAGPQTKKPQLSVTHRQKRLDWARSHRNWTVEDWKKVIFSDESKFNIFGSDGRTWCWKKVGQRLAPHAVKPTVKHGGGSIMIWGCMTWDGVGNITLIEGKMNSEVYQKILEEEYLDTLEDKGKSVSETILQQDNDPKHTSGSTRAWLEEKNIQVLPWAPQSPDMNPIEHLWNEVDRRLRRLPELPKNREDLWNKLLAVWIGIEPEFVQRLITSMPDRVAALEQAKGGYTRY